MKYIKKFENNRFKYKKGDKVIGVNVKTTHDIKKYVENNVGTIIDIDDLEHSFYYIVKYDSVNSDIRSRMSSTSYQYRLPEDKCAFPLHEEEIRLATPKEIELQKIKPNTDKYNL
jgi:hypothetical protein